MPGNCPPPQKDAPFRPGTREEKRFATVPRIQLLTYLPSCAHEGHCSRWRRGGSRREPGVMRQHPRHLPGAASSSLDCLCICPPHSCPRAPLPPAEQCVPSMIAGPPDTCSATKPRCSGESEPFFRSRPPSALGALPGLETQAPHPNAAPAAWPWLQTVRPSQTPGGCSKPAWTCLSGCA